jgi:hypothetical protein
VLQQGNAALSIDARLRQAIASKRLVEILYNGRRRVAEPHDYGRLNGVDRLLVYQLEADSSVGRNAIGWRLFNVAKIESLLILNAAFKGSRREFDQQHHSWDTVYARVSG